MLRGRERSREFIDDNDIEEDIHNAPTLPLRQKRFISNISIDRYSERTLHDYYESESEFVVEIIFIKLIIKTRDNIFYSNDSI